MGRGALRGRATARAARIAALAACTSLLLASLAAAQIATGQITTGQTGNGQAGGGKNGSGQTDTGQAGTGKNGGGQNGSGQNGSGQNGNGSRLVGAGAGSGTMDIALMQSYQSNPQLNSQRAATRAVDENVPTALAGYRPRVSGTASLTDQYLDNLSRQIGGSGNAQQSISPTTGGALYVQQRGQIAVQSYGITATQTLFNGLQTAGRTRQAEGQVFSARETLRTTEQTVLLSAATAYMNLLQTAAILELQRSNVNVLEVTLRQTRDRFTAGEVTRTDVAQAESRLSGGRSQLSLAESNYVTAQAQYLQVIGVPPPSRLAPAPPVDRLSPRTLDGAIARGRSEHPLITTAMYNVDIALQQVKIAEAALAPVVQAVGNVQKTYGSTTTLVQLENLSASLAAQLTVPIYQGGAEYAAIRQAKETLGQRRIDLDTARDQVQATVTQAWGQLEAAKAQIDATTTQVTSAEVALNGVREEARVGQRTTLDVLNAQQDLVNARVALVTAQRDRVVASYTVLASTGALSPPVLGLRVEVYDPVVHYQQVRDAWGGVRIPDGR
jgi:outer membrane protein